ncbi:MAG: AMP-binding protein, partial [Verrucomicrobiae bacterium]|nr:AMP-binding protein [Verrucomicrobiae bacterium]
MSDNIESHLVENRIFNPPAAFSAKAKVGSMEAYRELYDSSIADPESFWAGIASELAWQKPWDTVLEWNCPFAKWFVGGEINVSENCLDRHLAERGDKVAILWEGEPGDKRTLTYRQLHEETCRFANVLKANGIKTGDRVIIYMPMVPEAAVAMLACARIGAVHSVVFGGFSAESIKDRLHDSGAIAVITADGGWRRGSIVPLKESVNKALEGDTQVQRVITLKRTENDVTMVEGRDVWWHDEVAKVDANCPPQAFDSEHPLFILYTSGSTGKPKG